MPLGLRLSEGLGISLTFELSGRQRQDARPGPVKMYRVPPARAWWPAVGAPLERGVRPFLRLLLNAAADSLGAWTNPKGIVCLVLRIYPRGHREVGVDDSNNSVPCNAERYGKTNHCHEADSQSVDLKNGFLHRGPRVAAPSLCGLTFELSRTRRQNARPALQMMTCTVARARRFAVGARLERGVRQHSLRPQISRPDSAASQWLRSPSSTD
jgi:hypothetical protein